MHIYARTNITRLRLIFLIIACIIYNMKKAKFYKALRIICAVISALLVAGCVFVFIYLGVAAGFTTLLATAAFVLLMMVFKFKHEDAENALKENEENKEEATSESNSPSEEKAEEEKTTESLSKAENVEIEKADSPSDTENAEGGEGKPD